MTTLDRKRHSVKKLSFHNLIIIIIIIYNYYKDQQNQNWQPSTVDGKNNSLPLLFIFFNLNFSAVSSLLWKQYNFFLIVFLLFQQFCLCLFRFLCWFAIFFFIRFVIFLRFEGGLAARFCRKLHDIDVQKESHL